MFLVGGKQGNNRDFIESYPTFSIFDSNAELCPRDWRYLAEGAANVVFMYSGVNEKWKDKVVRIPKKLDNKASNKLDKAKMIHEFASTKLQRLLTSSHFYLQCAIAIPVDPHFISTLNANLLMDSTPRPVNRIGSELDVDISHVLVLLNVNAYFDLRYDSINRVDRVFSRTSSRICFEFKPKSGVMPSINNVRDESSTKTLVCRYCMHQHYKLHLNKVNCISKYCPLDLYSGDNFRTKRAILNLIDNPQNNFRVFSDTGLVISVNEWITSLSKKNFFENSSNPNDHVAGLISKVLEDIQVLKDIQRLQLLDLIDIEGIWCLQSFLEKIEDMSDSVLIRDVISNKEFKDSSEDEHVNISELLRNIEKNFQEIPNSEINANWSSLRICDFKEIYDKLLSNFLVSTTFKDCSLLMTILPISESGFDEDQLKSFEHVVKYAGRSYIIVIAIIDLDIKYHSKLPHYARLDQNIVSHFDERVGLENSQCSWTLQIR